MEELPAAVMAAVGATVLGIAGSLSLDTVLDRLVHAARDLSGARYAALGTPDDEGGFDRFVTAGMTDPEVEAMGPLPRTHGLLGAMLVDPHPFRTDDVTSDGRFRGWWPDAHPRMGSFLGVPIVFKGDVIGAFYLTDKANGVSFSAADEATISSLATHAGVLIENARLVGDSRELVVLAERSRLARDLHDALNQTLFSLRLRLETAASALPAQPAVARGELDEARSLVETAFVELRSVVFELRPAALAADGLAETLRKHLGNVGRAHGLAVRFQAPSEPPNAVLAPGTEDGLFRIAQEALTNAVRHADADHVGVELAIGAESVSLVVRDDGAGFDPAARAIRSRRLGLTSMRERAEALGGEVTVESSPGRGTTVRAEVPVAGAAARRA